MARTSAAWAGVALAWVGLWPAAARADPAAAARFQLVPEMETPRGVLYQGAEERRALNGPGGSREVLERFRGHVAQLWPAIRNVDLVVLSRYQLEATRGYALPTRPGPLAGEVVGRELGGTLHLELRGPRLPAAYDIVHRHLYLYVAYDPSRDRFGEVVVTIRGWILE